MAVKSLARSGQETTRELRGLALYRDHGEEIRYENGTWFVPSGTAAPTVYEVHLARRGEYCECSDFEFHGSRCKHVYAATIAKAKTAPCSGCGERFRFRNLTEVPEDHLSLFEGDLLCPECGLEHGVS